MIQKLFATKLKVFMYGIVTQFKSVYEKPDVHEEETHTWQRDLWVKVLAVKSRPVLHHCVVIFFWSSGIMECTCRLFTFENRVLLMR